MRGEGWSTADSKASGAKRGFRSTEVFIVSTTTSRGEYMPRFMDFPYSKNRLNVAVSRAKSLAIVIANPALLRIPRRSSEGMAMVNMLCWLRDCAHAASRGTQK
jgi:hypothetical protein